MEVDLKQKDETSFEISERQFFISCTYNIFDRISCAEELMEY